MTVVLLMVASLVVAARPASANLSSAVPLLGFADILYDADRDQVLVTGGSGSDGIAVFDGEGRLKTVIKDLPGAQWMLPDGDDVLVTLYDAAAIERIDLETLASVERISVLPLDRPRAIARAGGRLWFSHGHCQTLNAGIGSVDMATHEVVDHTALRYRCAELFASDAHPNLLVAVNGSSSPPTLTLFDVTSDPAFLNSRRLHGGMLREASVGPDGQTLLVATSSEDSVEELHIKDLSSAGRLYVSGEWTTAVDSVDGFVAVGVHQSGRDAAAFTGTSMPHRVQNWPGTTQPRGIALAPGAEKMFVVTAGGSQIWLNVADRAYLPGSDLTIEASASQVAEDDPVVLSGKLSLQDGTDPRGREISVLRGRADDPPVVVGSDITDDVGRFQVTDRPSAYGTYTYLANWTGDDGHGGTNSVEVAVEVQPRQKPTALTLEASPRSVEPRESVQLNGVLTVAESRQPSGQTIVISRAQDDGPFTTVGSTVTDGGGSYEFADAPGEEATFSYRAEFKGDTFNEPSVSSSISVVAAYPPCEPPDESDVVLAGVYVAGTEVWFERNGLSGLQKQPYECPDGSTAPPDLHLA